MLERERSGDPLRRGNLHLHPCWLQFRTEDGQMIYLHRLQPHYISANFYAAPQGEPGAASGVAAAPRCGRTAVALSSLHAGGTCGGLLADAMGLGKTLQMIMLVLKNPAPQGWAITDYKESQGVPAKPRRKSNTGAPHVERSPHITAALSGRHRVGVRGEAAAQPQDDPHCGSQQLEAAVAARAQQAPQVRGHEMVSAWRNPSRRSQEDCFHCRPQRHDVKMTSLPLVRGGLGGCQRSARRRGTLCVSCRCTYSTSASEGQLGYRGKNAITQLWGYDDSKNLVPLHECDVAVVTYEALMNELRRLKRFARQAGGCREATR